LPLAEFIDNCYDGDMARLSNDLNKAIYLLHHVKEDEIADDIIEDVSFVLYEISQQLFSSYLRKTTD